MKNEIEKITRFLKKEMDTIASIHGPIDDWLDVDVEDMGGESAFHRGRYRAFYNILTKLDKALKD